MEFSLYCPFLLDQILFYWAECCICFANSANDFMVHGTLVVDETSKVCKVFHNLYFALTSGDIKEHHMLTYQHILSLLTTDC